MTTYCTIAYSSTTTLLLFDWQYLVFGLDQEQCENRYKENLKLLGVRDICDSVSKY